tara:strand:- start:147 stop:758 length:612 start_codon:yes stop_codon:yes gene_type:complete
MAELYSYDNDWDEKYLSKTLLKSEYKYDFIADEVCNGAFLFPLFSQDFCEELVLDLESFDGWTENRHDNYPTNDVLLKDFNKPLFDIYECILKNILIPATNKLYSIHIKPKEVKEETFIIRYKPSNQSMLDLHHDSSLFTCGIQLSSDLNYIGGDLYMPQHKLSLKAEQGKVLIHPGRLTHKHGVRPVISGEKYSLISFCKYG